MRFSWKSFTSRVTNNSLFGVLMARSTAAPQIKTGIPAAPVSFCTIEAITMMYLTKQSGRADHYAPKYKPQN